MMNFRDLQVFTSQAIPQITIKSNFIPVSMIVINVTTPILEFLDGSFPSPRKTDLTPVSKVTSPERDPSLAETPPSHVPPKPGFVNQPVMRQSSQVTSPAKFSFKSQNAQR